MKIFANMVVGDRPEPFLRWSLLSVEPIVDMVVVCRNTISDKSGEVVVGGDGDLHISKPRLEDDYNLSVIEEVVPKHKLRLSTIPFSNFSAIRNWCLEQSTDADWIIRIDADEILYTERVSSLLRRLIHDKESNVIWAFFYHFLRDLDTVHNHPGFDIRYFQRMIFRNCYWGGEVHELLVDAESGQPTKHDSPGALLIRDHLFAHYGYCLPDIWIFDKWEQYQQLTDKPNFYDYMASDVINEKTGEPDRPWTVLKSRDGFRFEEDHPLVVRQYRRQIEEELNKVTSRTDHLVYYETFCRRVGLNNDA